MFSKLQRYMAGTAIVKAWVFGSFARGEEKKDSDLDILVDYDPSANLSLLGAIRYKLDMEKLIGKAKAFGIDRDELRQILDVIWEE